ncbi:MAG: radical SAM protein [Proteobacteria bacterium]|nr:radical SAM protein [Pseudomonadota bacterium]
MATRGCPHKCTYCASTGPQRRRSVDSTIEQLQWIIRRYPFVQTIYEFDDTFFANRQSWLRHFANAYSQNIGLPWHCQTSPSTLNRAKLDFLVDSGLVYCEMGVQSGSDETRTLYGRAESDDQVRAAAALLHQYHLSSKIMRPRYHVITDNPWESEANVLTTVNLLLDLPRPFDLAIGSLCLFPGTQLNRKAIAEGLLWDESLQVHRKPFLLPQANFLNWLIVASATDWLPKPLLRRLAHPSVVRQMGGAQVSTRTRLLHGSTNAGNHLPRATEILRHRDLRRLLGALHQMR